ncbi:MAG TPA: efflux RND transporter periplasmic adaptor subunit [Xanthomonadaceae bacterium]|nr:efflux RND transporter periplasmic adaptor subunit [Xanthomonadaceae bacterium]
MRPSIRAFLIVAILALPFALAACSGGQVAADPPRPALVVHPGPLDQGAQAFAGSVVAREQSPLSFQIGGHLVRRLVDMGARVKKGQVLAQIDPKDVGLNVDAARAQLVTAQADLQLAQAERDRYQALAGKQAVSRSQLDTVDNTFKAASARVQQAQAQLDVARNQAGYADLRAPSDGVIAQRLAEAGQVVSPGQAVFTLAGDGDREVQISIPEQRVTSFKVGMPVLVELWAQQGHMIPGRIREMSPVADVQARTFAARVELPAGTSVELGQSARVYAADGPGAGLSVPLAAVFAKDGAPALWVVTPDPHATSADGASTGSLHLLPVRLGPYGEERVPVLSGIKSDDWILAAGVHLVREGQKVAPVDRDNRAISFDAAAPSTAER